MRQLVYTINETTTRAHCVYAQAVCDKTLTQEEFIARIAKNTTYSESEVTGVLMEAASAVLDACGEGMSVEVLKGWITFYPIVQCTMKDYVDENGITVRVTPEMLTLTPKNTRARIGCRVSKIYQNKFDRDVHYEKSNR